MLFASMSFLAVIPSVFRIPDPAEVTNRGYTAATLNLSLDSCCSVSLTQKRLVGLLHLRDSVFGRANVVVLRCTFDIQMTCMACIDQ